MFLPVLKHQVLEILLNGQFLLYYSSMMSTVVTADFTVTNTLLWIKNSLERLFFQSLAHAVAVRPDSKAPSPIIAVLGPGLCPSSPVWRPLPSGWWFWDSKHHSAPAGSRSVLWLFYCSWVPKKQWLKKQRTTQLWVRLSWPSEFSGIAFSLVSAGVNVRVFGDPGGASSLILVGFFQYSIGSDYKIQSLSWVKDDNNQIYFFLNTFEQIASVVSDTQEARVVGSLEPRKSRVV